MTRQAIFDLVKADRGGRGFMPMEVALLDSTLTTLGVPVDGAVLQPPAAPADAFTTALKEILHHEGGFVNHPRDPGGMTNLGVTKRTWEDWTGKPASESEMRSLTPENVAPVYRKNYWDAVKGDELPLPLALCVFDFAINAGTGRAIRYLQRMVGVPQDGKLGPVTMAAVKAFVGSHGAAHAAQQYQDARRGYYRSLGTFNTFGKGWLRRVDEVEAKALEMAR